MLSQFKQFLPTLKLFPNHTPSKNYDQFDHKKNQIKINCFIQNDHKHTNK